jgi:hypothetical protein
MQPTLKVTGCLIVAMNTSNSKETVNLALPEKRCRKHVNTFSRSGENNQTQGFEEATVFVQKVEQEGLFV